MTEAPEKIWAFTNGFLKNWSSHGEGKLTTEYTRSDIAQARIDNLHQIWVYRDLTQADFDKAFKD
jgi:hypothetical protein